MPDLQTRVEHLETDVAQLQGQTKLAVREAAVADAAVQLVHDNVVHLASRVSLGFQEMRESFTRVDERFAGVDAELAELRSDVTGLRGEMTEVRDRLTGVEGRLTGIEGILEQIRDRLR
jgi:phage shock protein A